MKNTKIYIISYLICLMSMCGTSCAAQDMKTMSIAELREGDLLFCAKQDGNNITDVTQGVGGLKIDPVAIFHRCHKGAFALEAIHKGVGLTPLDSFLARREAIVCGRLKDTVGVARSVERAMRNIGKPYDFNFMPDDSAFYCSELVQKNYRYKNGDLVFKPIPMSFHDKTGRITPFWHDYYARQNLRVPEGEPGSNPGDLSRSDALTILGRLKEYYTGE